MLFEVWYCNEDRLHYSIFRVLRPDYITATLCNICYDIVRDALCNFSPSSQSSISSAQGIFHSQYNVPLKPKCNARLLIKSQSQNATRLPPFPDALQAAPSYPIFFSFSELLCSLDSISSIFRPSYLHRCRSIPFASFLPQANCHAIVAIPFCQCRQQTCLAQRPS